MSPWPSRASAPPWSRITRESCLRGDRERDPRRDVHLDRAGDDVHGRPLGGEHEVDADRARLLREPDDRVLHLGGRDHHQVGELVDHAQDVRKRRLPGGGAGAVQLDDVARARLLHHLVAALHLADQVREHVRRHARHGHDRREQVRDVLVVVQLDALRVDQHHADLVRGGAQQDRRQHRVHAARLARAGGAGDQQVRHLREVGPDRVAGDVLAEPHRQRRAATTAFAAAPRRGRGGRCRPGTPSGGACWAPPRRPPACRGSAPGCGCRSRRARRRCRPSAA